MNFFWSIFIILILLAVYLHFFCRKSRRESKRCNKTHPHEEQAQHHLQEEDERTIIPSRQPPSPNDEYDVMIHSPRQVSEERNNAAIFPICRQIARHFSLPETMIQRVVMESHGGNNVEEDYPALVYLVMTGCGKHLSHQKKIEMGTFVVWKSNHQDHIDHVYQIIMGMSGDQRLDKKVRANAVDVLMRSNNRRYMDIAKRELDRLRHEERRADVQRIHDRMQQVRQEVNTLQTRIATTPPPRLHVHHPNNIHPVARVVDLRREDVALQQALLDEYRRLERQLGHGKSRTVYDDSQNVHNHAINESVIQSASLLVKDKNRLASSPLDLEKVLMEVHPSQEDKWRKSLRRIETDATKFKDGMTLRDVLQKVVGVVSASPHRDEMLRRLGEELVDMDGLCATGHLSRLVNVLQGFEDTPEDLRIRINPKDEIYASLSSYLTAELQNADEQLMEDMMETDADKKQNYYEFMSGALGRKHQELCKEYQGVLSEGEVSEHVRDAFRKYLNHEDDCRVILSRSNM